MIWNMLDQFVVPAEHPELDVLLSVALGGPAELEPEVAPAAPTMGADEFDLAITLGFSQLPAAAAKVPRPRALALANIAGQYLPANSSWSELTRAIKRSE